MNEVAARTNLLDLDREGLERFFADELGEKRFRAHQVMKWMYHRHVTDFAEMTDLGKVLRAKLEDKAEVLPPAIQFEKPALDGTHEREVLRLPAHAPLPFANRPSASQPAGQRSRTRPTLGTAVRSR